MLAPPLGASQNSDDAPAVDTKVLAAAVAIIAALAMIAGGVGVWWLDRPAPAPVVAFHIETAEPMRENYGVNTIAVSPDGKHLVYVLGDDDRQHLVHRPVDRFEATPIQGSEGARGPFFSPNSEWVGFWARDRLMKVSVQGGRPVDLCEDCGRTSTWSPSGDVIISVKDGSLWQIPAAGGEPTIVLESKTGEPGYRRPAFLPDGRSLLVEVRSAPRSKVPATLDPGGLQRHGGENPRPRV